MPEIKEKGKKEREKLLPITSRAENTKTDMQTSDKTMDKTFKQHLLGLESIDELVCF